MATLRQYQPWASDSRFAFDATAAYTYSTAKVAPPGVQAIAPHGFPASPFPPASASTAVPQAFIDAMVVRVRVFVDEQHCSAEAELDEDDARSWHWVLYAAAADRGAIPVSVIRIVPPPHGPHPNEHPGPDAGADDDERPYVKLGRVATMPEWRGKGLSRRLIAEAVAWLEEHGRDEAVGGAGWQGDVLCHAQVAVEGMYERVGFRTDARLGRWVEEGIEHLGMWRRIGLDRCVEKGPR